MWIDGFGWVQFDPTPRNLAEPADRQFQTESITAGFDAREYIPLLGPDGSPIERPADSPFGFFEDVLLGDPQSPPSSDPRWWLLFTLVALVALFIPTVAKSIRTRRRFNAAKTGDVTAAWDELIDRLGDLGQPVPSSQTPMEFAHNTDPALVGLAVAYSATIYGGRTLDSAESNLVELDYWLNTNYSGAERALARINPRSLLKRD